MLVRCDDNIKGGKIQISFIIKNWKQAKEHSWYTTYFPGNIDICVFNTLEGCHTDDLRIIDVISFLSIHLSDAQQKDKCFRHLILKQFLHFFTSAAYLYVCSLFLFLAENEGGSN